MAKHPDLFEVATPVNVDIFENLLQDHPNPAFVQSVCDGLRFGFWPWANTRKPDYPDTLDLTPLSPVDAVRRAFFQTQLTHELHTERYSPTMGPHLLPGMYCMPVYAVPKPHSDDLRLVNDHSASKHSLNSMVDHDQVTGYPMDNLAHFGRTASFCPACRPCPWSLPLLLTP